jgi:hypothetical protein
VAAAEEMTALSAAGAAGRDLEEGLEGDAPSGGPRGGPGFCAQCCGKGAPAGGGCCGPGCARGMRYMLLPPGRRCVPRGESFFVGCQMGFFPLRLTGARALGASGGDGYWRQAGRFFVWQVRARPVGGLKGGAPPCCRGPGSIPVAALFAPGRAPAPRTHGDTTPHPLPQFVIWLAGALMLMVITLAVAPEGAAEVPNIRAYVEVGHAA